MRNRFVLASLLATSLLGCNKNFSWSPGSGGSSSSSSNGSSDSNNGSSNGSSGDSSNSSSNGSSPSAAAVPTCPLKEAKLALEHDAQGDSPAVGDFNGDGKLDVAFSEMKGRSDTRYKPSGDVRVFLGNGDGTFGAAIVTPIPVNESWQPLAVAGDFDGDGKTDLVLADQTSPSHGDVAYIVLVGKGNGTFGKPLVTSHVDFFGFYNVRAFDIDGDKKADLVATVQYENAPPHIVVLRGGAGGKLGKPTTWKFSGGTRDIMNELAYDGKFNWEVADIDHDGSPEIVAAPNGIAAVDFDRDQGYGNFGVCTVSLTKKGTVEKPQCVESTDQYKAATVAVADFNGDGQLDVASGPEEHSYPSSEAHLDVVMNAGKGVLEKKRRPIKADQSPLTAFWNLDARDVTGDGKADIIALGLKSGGGTAAFVLVGNGDGSFTKSVIGTTTYEANANAAWAQFGAFQGAGTLGVVISAFEGPDSVVHVYSGKCH